MHARLTLHKARMDRRVEAERTADEMARLFRGQPGLKHIFFLIDSHNEEIGTFSVWESKEAAETVLAIVGPQVRKIADAAGTRVGERVPPREFEVYEPES